MVETSYPFKRVRITTTPINERGFHVPTQPSSTQVKKAHGIENELSSTSFFHDNIYGTYRLKSIAQIEKEAIRHALLFRRGNRSLVAAELGIGRSTLYRKLSLYDIDFR